MQISSVNERKLQGGLPVYIACCRIDRIVRSPFADGGPCRVFCSSAATIASEHHLQNELSADFSTKCSA
jgi:hypothetical protein